ncbi:glycosyltransferase family 2 protein [Paenibacillus filicis]
MAVVLSTYNGEKYLEAQLDSLLAQTDSNFRLVLRDDGSTDQTLRLLQHKRSQFPYVQWVDAKENLGAKLSFACLVEAALEDPNVNYVMFCDQDDVWHPDKVSRSKREIQLLEKELGMHTPLLVHGDLQVVDADLRQLSSSFVHYQHLDPTQTSLSRMLTQNVVTGCTMIINRRLAELACPIPPQAIMHDWWIAVVASAFGRIVFIHEASIDYRQHGSNTLGASAYTLPNQMYSTYKKKSISFLFEQAEAFRSQYGDRLPARQRDVVEQFIRLKTAPRFRKIKMVYRERFLKHGFLHNIGFLLKLMSIKD